MKASMERLIQGVRAFHDKVFIPNREAHVEMANGQKPLAIFITCADSRITPHLLTQTGPGELFILRNAGNIVPPYGPSPDGMSGSIEYGIKVLNIKHIVICGHSNCGAMSGLLDEKNMDSLGAVKRWLVHAEPVRTLTQSCACELDTSGQVNYAVEQNVKLQLDHLKTHPAVAVGLAQRTLQLHGWVYRIGEGTVDEYDPISDRFLSVLKFPPGTIQARGGVA